MVKCRLSCKTQKAFVDKLVSELANTSEDLNVTKVEFSREREAHLLEASEQREARSKLESEIVSLRQHLSEMDDGIRDLSAEKDTLASNSEHSIHALSNQLALSEEVRLVTEQQLAAKTAECAAAHLQHAAAQHQVEQHADQEAQWVLQLAALTARVQELQADIDMLA
jgi:chromosome segregation ATPase